jgi:hypothetical protein
MMRFIPTRAAIAGALVAIFAALMAWARRDARNDLAQETELEDLKNADEIRDRVSDSRADPERLRDDLGGAGYRD